VASAPGRACDTPVYRYALEHWNPDSYSIAAPPDSGGREFVAALEKRLHAGPPVNLVVRRIDADHPAQEAGSPHVVVRLPGAGNGVVWEGPLGAGAIAAVTDSPCRRLIADRLLAGDAVVWVFLRSGRRDPDEAAAERIQPELKRPDAEGQPPLPCSLVPVSRSDQAEKLLVETLLSTEPDLRGRDEPMAFPVFGRGRVLYALVGAGVNAENVRHTLDFLVGGCSCTIKRENPGVDLLLTADWSVITPTTPEEKPALSAADDDEVVPLTPLPVKPNHPSVAAAPPARSASWLVGGVGAAAVLVVVTGWLALRSMKRAI